MFSVYRKRCIIILLTTLIFLATSIFFASELVKQEFVYDNIKEKLDHYIEYSKDVACPSFGECLLLQELASQPFGDGNIISVEVYTKSEKEFKFNKVKIEK